MALIRIVRMTFRPDKVNDFLALFNEYQHKIAEVEGCDHLELHRDIDNSTVFATYSLWDDPRSLDWYRQSDLFNEVWGKTKALFGGKPQAFSHERMYTVER